MILQALKEYYDRKPELPRYGFEKKEIGYVVTLKHDGTPVTIQSTYEGTGKARRAKSYLVPMSVKRTVGIKANLLWDNPEYALGTVTPKKKQSKKKSESTIEKRVAQQHEAFRERLSDLKTDSDEGIGAVISFLARDDKEESLKAFGDVWIELLESGANVTFKLAGHERLIFERESVVSAIQSMQGDENASKSVCLVTGDTTPIAALHSPIKGVWGAQTSGANVVSFNLDAFRSFNKKQGANAPIGEYAAFAYTTALNHLLRRDSPQRMQVGDSSTVFWSSRPTQLETQIVDFFGEPPKDDPDRNTRAVKDLYTSVTSGALPASEENSRFYILGLSPNASRIAVRFWIADTVDEIATRIYQHFMDTTIRHGPKEKSVLSLFRLLISTATHGKSENIAANLAGDTMRAILQGQPYPRALLQSTIRRIKAEHEITYPRAALIKAVINRQTRFINPCIEEELKVSLDETNNNTGYRLGRLFAVLEKIQSEANPGLNATIRDKFYGAASSTPVTVFGNLMRLKNHHLAKLENPGRRVNLEKLVANVMSEIDDFPPHLRMEDQGRFAIGYYHQMQAFYTKKQKQEQE